VKRTWSEIYKSMD